jgi:hypothetical protein
MCLLAGQNRTSTPEGLVTIMLTISPFGDWSKYPVVPAGCFEQLWKCRNVTNIEQMSSVIKQTVFNLKQNELANSFIIMSSPKPQKLLNNNAVENESHNHIDSMTFVTGELLVDLYSESLWHLKSSPRYLYIEALHLFTFQTVRM